MRSTEAGGAWVIGFDSRRMTGTPERFLSCSWRNQAFAGIIPKLELLPRLLMIWKFINNNSCPRPQCVRI